MCAREPVRTMQRMLVLGLLAGLAGCGQPRVTRQDTVISARDELPGTPEESLVRMGDSMRSSGDLAGASQFYSAAVAREPGDTVALVKLGEADLALGDAGRAEQAFRTALAGAPGNHDASVGLGVALLAGGNAAAALPLLEPVAQAGRNARVLRNYGVALDMLGRQPEAQAAYRRGIERAPADPDLHGNLALSLAVSGDMAAAGKEAATAADLPNAPERARENQVVLLAMAGQEQAARVAGRRLANPSAVAALVARGERARGADTPAGRAAALGTVTAGSTN